MKKITLFLFALFTCWQINAQVSSYGFSHFLGTYTENSAGATTIPDVRADSFISTAQNIGFNFVYDGITYTQFKMSSNGFISLNMSGTSSLNTNDLSAANATSRPIIAPLWDDLDGGDVASSVASYELSGVAPNRVLTVEWRNWQWNYNATTNPVISFQVKLYETTNIIDFIYRQEVGAIVSGSASVGIGSATGSGAGSYLSLSDVATPAVSSTTSTNTLNTKPATGQVYRFTPPSCSSPSGFAVSNLTTTSATISWNAAVPVPSTGYEYYYSNVNTPPAGAGTPTTALTDNLSGLTPNTTYYVWLRSDCGGGTFSAWAGPFTFYTGYCIPSSTSSSSFVDNFTTSGGTQNISNLTSGFTTGGYLDATSQVVESYENGSFDFNATIQGPTVGFAIWIDWNNNLVFEASEKVYNTTAYGSGPFSGTITVPGGTALGNYRMRITTDWNSLNPSNPCAAAARAEFEDYTVTVGNPPACLVPNTIIASNITSSTVDLSWTDGSGGSQFDYEYVIQSPGTGQPTGPGAPIGDVSVVAEGFDIDGNPLTPDTLYEVYVRAVCNGGADFSTWAGPITFRTLCETVTSFVQNFDGITTPAFPSCWGKVGATGAANTQTGSPNSTPNTLYMYSNSTSNLAVVAMQPVSNLGAGTHRLRMNMRANFTTNGVIEFGYLTDPNNAASFVLISSVTAATTTYQQYVITPPAGSYSNFPAFRHTGSPANSILIDDVVWEQIPVTPPTCATNVVATPHSTCGNYANSITWDVTSGADGYYVTIGTTTGGNNIANAIPVSGTSYNFTGNFNTTYFYTIVPFNANGSATGCTEQSFATNVNGCYCVSAPTSVDGSGITNVQLVATNFANTVSTSPVYNDHTATVVDMSQGISNSVQITFNTDSFGTSYDYNTVIWIDVNDNFTFEPSEIVFTGVSAAVSPTILNASFVMPGTAPLGQHRMRIVATDDLQTPANPCYSGTYGETADFIVNIVAASCTPPAATTTVVPACGTAQYSIDVNVTALGSGTPSITDGTTTWPVSAIGVVNVGPFASGSSVNLTLLHGLDTTCNLPLGNFVYNCPLANDDLCNAIPLVVNAISTGTQYNNIGATSETNEPIASCFEDGINGSVWFSFVAPASGEVIITTDIAGASATDTEIALYDATGVTCSDLSTLGAPIGCDQDGGTTIIYNSILVQAGLTPGTTYYIQVDDYGYGTGQGTFGIEVQEVLSSDLFDNNNFMAYPNPVKDVLNVSYTSEISSIRVINMIGQEVISKNINATSTQVDMSQLSAGTYIVNVTVGDNVKTLKVVKQ